ncbi:amidase [Brevibacterium samyangense]|uniref:Amidase n=1 Tax=Brevibacterium samyangense TaxID=366888 RepID=A0ABN2TBC2_9MICO
MHEDLAYLELTEIAELIRTRQITSTEVTTKILERIDALQDRLQPYATVMRTEALAAAARADEEISRGRYRGPLHGVPVAVKDLACTVDAPTGAGTTIFEGFMADHDATVVTRLLDAGAVLLGKLRMTEGAFTSHHPDLPSPVNPWDAETWAGSSSSGSGVATAAGLAYATLGSDTGGSIRLPSSQNGITGLKPTWGRVSRYGIFDLAQSLDHVGPMCRSAKDAAVVLSVIAGRDENDPTSAVVPVPAYEDNLRLPCAPVVGFDPSLNAHFDEETRDMLARTLTTVRELGWRVVEVETPGFLEAAEDWQGLCAVETAQVHAETYPSRKDEYGPALAGLIEQGRAMTVIKYQTLMERRRAFTGNMHRLFADIDLLLIPGVGIASPTLAQIDKLGEDPEVLAGVIVPTAPLDNCGFPTITLPSGTSRRGTPLAIQFAAGPFQEQLLFGAGAAFQAATDFHRSHPEL